MVKQKTLAGVLLALFFAASCEDLPNIPVSINLGVSPKEVTIPAGGGSATVSFTSPVAWQASSSESWLEISPASGEAGEITLTLTASVNETFDQRSATVTVTVPSANLSEAVKVIQPGAEPPFVPSLEVSAESLSVPAAGGSFSITITSNVDWKAECAATDWIALSNLSGNAGTSTISVSVLENTATQPRRSSITISGGELQKTVAVSQEAAPDQPNDDVGGIGGDVNDWGEGGEIGFEQE